jgi:hypothetical protein
MNILALQGAECQALAQDINYHNYQPLIIDSQNQIKKASAFFDKTFCPYRADFLYTFTRTGYNTFVTETKLPLEHTNPDFFNNYENLNVHLKYEENDGTYQMTMYLYDPETLDRCSFKPGFIKYKFYNNGFNVPMLVENAVYLPLGIVDQFSFLLPSALLWDITYSFYGSYFYGSINS